MPKKKKNLLQNTTCASRFSAQVTRARGHFVMTIIKTACMHSTPEFNSATLVNSQLACLLSVGIFNPVMFSLKYLFPILECSAPLAYCYHHLPGNNKGHLFIFIAFS